jgi:hypothetical protein
MTNQELFRSFRGSVEALDVAIRTGNFQLYVVSRQNVDAYLELIDSRIKEIAISSNFEVEC